MVAWRYEISLLELKNIIFHSFAALIREIFLRILEEKFRISAWLLCIILLLHKLTYLRTIKCLLLIATYNTDKKLSGLNFIQSKTQYQTAKTGWLKVKNKFI